jgi:hypothetical protein
MLQGRIPVVQTWNTPEAANGRKIVTAAAIGPELAAALGETPTA